MPFIHFQLILFVPTRTWCYEIRAKHYSKKWKAEAFVFETEGVLDCCGADIMRSELNVNQSKKWKAEAFDDHPIAFVSWWLLRCRVITSVRTRQNFQARALGDFHDRVSSAARAWGHKFSSEAMHVYMGENMFSLWNYYIGTVFKSIQLSIDIYRVSNHHLYPSNDWWTTQFIQTSMSHHILPFLRRILGWRTSRHACRLVVANVTFQYPAAPLRILQFLSMCIENVSLFRGGLPLDVLSILEAGGHNVVMSLWG